ncbi:hypothetical protein G6011_04140 [Alternaria panax]|uniref:Uncharacterized protein n=1 Tax=Alternaria panax TaxID=48097 RepID=A0AAD4IGL4_9PLEO|nr:hypothetical protein G6011_04140 [Alternaria panax]
MASSFVGLSVAVTLQSPPVAVVVGVVSGVDQSMATLTLQDVFFPNTGHRVPSCNVEGSIITDIKVTPSAPAPPRLERPAYPRYPENHVQHPPPHTGRQAIPPIGALAW